MAPLAKCDKEGIIIIPYEYDYITIRVESWIHNTIGMRRSPAASSNWRTEANGCMEERSTYEITDYDNVDLAQALDLDLDKVPTNRRRTLAAEVSPTSSANGRSIGTATARLRLPQ